MSIFKKAALPTVPDIDFDKKENIFKRTARRIRSCEYSYLFFAFFLPAVLMFTVYAALGTYPFGRSSVLVLDLNGQYVYFFEALRDIVYGEGSLLYSFGRALGGEFMGIYAYYLASPLSYIVCLFPKHAILEALYTMLVLKCGLSGLTFGYYIHKSAKVKGKATTVAFSIMYALMGYAVIYQHNTMWIDNVILLPLVALGIEELIAKRKYKLFTLSLALCVMSNFYIGYMTCIFVAIYTAYAYLTREDKENNPLGERFHLPRSILRVAIFSVIALAIACAVLIPAVYALQFGKNDFSNPNFSPTQRFDFLNFFAQFYTGTYHTVRPEGMPIVYCGLLALIMFPLYLCTKHRPRRERVGTALVCILFILCFNFNPVDMAWHGFQIPNWLNYRYSYMLCFFILVAGRKAYDSLSEFSSKTVLTICGALAGMLMIIQNLGFENVPDFAAVWLSLGFITVYAIAIASNINTKTRETNAMILAVIVCLEMFTSSLLNLVALDEDVVISSYDSYHNFIDSIQPIIDEVKEEDTSFYRMEKNDHRKVCDPYALGLRGLSNSTSTLNDETILFLQRMGYSSQSHWSKYLGGTPISDSLLGIKYLFAKSGDEYVDVEMWGDEIKEDTEEGYVAYRNIYALSLACAVSPDYKEVYFSDPNPQPEEVTDEEGNVSLVYPEDYEKISYKEINSPIERLNAIITAMLGTEKDISKLDSVPDEEITFSVSGMTYEEKEGVITFTRTPEIEEEEYFDDETFTNFSYVVKMPRTGRLYIALPAEEEAEYDLYAAGDYIGTYKTSDDAVLVGEFRKNARVNILIVPKNDSISINSIEKRFFYSIVENVFVPLEEVETSYSNLNLTFVAQHKKYAPINDKAAGTLTYTAICDRSGMLYAYFPSKYPREVELTVNGTPKGTYYGNETKRIVLLGEFEEGETVTLTMKLKSNDLYIMSGEEFFYMIDYDAAKAALTEITKGNYQIEEYTESYFKGTITAAEGKTAVYTSIPYDEGWNVYIDGEKAEIYKTLDALITFDISEGTHVLELRYMPKAYVIAFSATGAGILVFILILIFENPLSKLYKKIMPKDIPWEIRDEEARIERERRAAIRAAKEAAEAEEANASANGTNADTDANADTDTSADTDANAAKRDNEENAVSDNKNTASSESDASKESSASTKQNTPPLVISDEEVLK